MPVQKKKKVMEDEDGSGNQSHDSVPVLCALCYRTVRPKLADVLELQASLKRLPVRLSEGVALDCLVDRVLRWLERTRAALATDEVSTLRKQNENNRCSGTKNPLFKTRVENSTVAIVPLQLPSDEQETVHPCISNTTLEDLEALLVEGDLLEVKLEEKDTLRSILCCCCPERFSVLMFQHMNVSVSAVEPSNVSCQVKRKSSVDSAAAVMLKSPRSKSCLAAPRMVEDISDVVVIDDDDDDNDGDDDNKKNVNNDDVESCAAEKCLKPLGDEVTWVQCDLCDRCYHFQCLGLNYGFECKSFVCKHCLPANHTATTALSTTSSHTRRSAVAGATRSIHKLEQHCRIPDASANGDVELKPGSTTNGDSDDDNSGPLKEFCEGEIICYHHRCTTAAAKLENVAGRHLYDDDVIIIE
jgi:hypothetical protein